MTDNTVAMTVRIPKDLYERLRRYAFDSHRKQVDVVREALDQHLESLKPAH